MFLDNILSHFIFYIPDEMIVSDKNIYYYKNEYYTDSIEIKENNKEFYYVTNNKLYENNYKTIFVNKFKFFRGNDNPSFYDKYTFTIDSWNNGIKNFESKYTIFNEGNELSITLLYNLICRTLYKLEINNCEQHYSYLKIIFNICNDLNLKFCLKNENSSIIITNMKNINIDKIKQLQIFDKLILG